MIAARHALGMLDDADGARHVIEQAQARNPRFAAEGFRNYLLAISAEIGDSARRKTDGLVKAGLIAPVTHVSAA